MATQLAPVEGGRALHPVQKFEHQLAERAIEFKKGLPGHISIGKFQRTVMTAVASNLELLTADRQSLINSCFKAAQDGLLPDGREAALVIFRDNKKQADGSWRQIKVVQYMPMVYGLRKKILQSGEIRDIQTQVVYRQEVEAGLFIYEEGTERMLRHKPLLDAGFNPSDDDIVAAYSVATFTDGTKSFEVMPRRDINKVREASQAGATRDKRGKPRDPSGPWVDWFSEMARKSVMRRHAKTLPMSGDILGEIERDDEEFAAYSTQHVLGAQEPDEPIASQDRLTSDAADRADPSTGEVFEGDATMRLEDARAEIDSAELVPDVNKRLAELEPLLSESDAEELRLYAMDRIASLRGK